jgi:threonine dehydrogenase-like Zn-dependent dehydrogenase
MRAFQVVRPGLIKMVNTPDLMLPGDGYIIVELKRGLLCGSDVPIVYGSDHYHEFPLAPGVGLHECTGRVTASSSPRFEPGDRVVAVPINNSRALSQYYLAEESAAIKLPEALNPVELQPLIQPLSTVLYAADKLGEVKGLKVNILGGGPMGLLMTWVMHLRGADRISLIDPVEERCELGKVLGATDALAMTSSVARNLQRGNLVDLDRADICVELVGHQQEVVNDAIYLVRKEGRLLMLGIPDQKVYAFEFEPMLRKNLTLITSVTPDWVRYLGLAADLLLEHGQKVLPLITHRFPIDEVQKAYELFRARAEGVGKVLVSVGPDTWSE